MPNKARPTMERRRLSFPSTDTTVRDWLSAQSDPSASMRLIIRDTVAREGYSDVMCRRVEQSQPEQARLRQHSEPVNQALQNPQVQVDQVSASPSSDVEDFFSAMRP